MPSHMSSSLTMVVTWVPCTHLNTRLFHVHTIIRHRAAKRRDGRRKGKGPEGKGTGKGTDSGYDVCAHVFLVLFTGDWERGGKRERGRGRNKPL